MTDPNTPNPDPTDDTSDTAPTKPLTPTTPLDQTTPLAQTPPTPTTTPPVTKAEAAPAATAEPVPRRRPLFPTMLWGILMLAFAAFMGARELVPGGLDLVTWLLTAVVGIGLLLVVAGIAAASRRAG